MSHDSGKAFESLILRTLAPILAAFMQLYALYVLLHGHYSPGGGFQGGVILAASFILPQLMDGARRSYPRLGKRGAIVAGALGVAIYALFAVLPLFAGRPVLDYEALTWAGPAPAYRRSMGILGIEVGVMLAVAGSMLSIFYSLRDGSEPPRP